MLKALQPMRCHFVHVVVVVVVVVIVRYFLHTQQETNPNGQPCRRATHHTIVLIVVTSPFFMSLNATLTSLQLRKMSTCHPRHFSNVHCHVTKGRMTPYLKSVFSSERVPSKSHAEPVLELVAWLTSDPSSKAKNACCVSSASTPHAHMTASVLIVAGTHSIN